MHRLLALTACLASASTFAGATLVYELKGAQRHRVVTLGVEGKQLYAEVSVDDALESTLVRDGEAKRSSIAMHGKKQLIEITDADAVKMKEKLTALREQMRARMKPQLEKMTPEQRAQVEAMMGGPDAAALQAAKVTYQKKGGSLTVAGYPCELYTVKRDGKVDGEACFAPRAKLGAAADELRAQLKELMSGFAFAPQTLGSAFDWADGAPGFPVLYRRFDEQGQVAAESTLKSLTKGTVPPAKFTLPADYKRVVAPGMGGGMAGPGAVPPPAP